MNYEQKYRKALGWMRSLYSGLHGATKEDAEHYFPELKESEDERVKKRILLSLEKDLMATKNSGCSTKDLEDCITWLEKQGEQKHFSDFKAEDWYVSKVDGKIHNMTYNPTDKVEPKFKVGDWITDGHLICKVLSVTGKSYELHLHNDDYCHFETDVQSVDKRYHLWTIEDAKDGDVLASEDKDKIFLYNGKLDLRGRACAYCGIYKTYDGLRFAKCTVGNYFTYKEPYPTTKEQRDTLFAKMKEAGYEWDSEKNELKKVEQGNHPRIVMADFTGGEGFYKLNLDNLNEEQVFAIEIMINNPKPGKKIDADKVIEWLKNNGWCTVGGPKVEMAQINKFKNDFGL